jgi:hypothetical protein
MPAVAGRPEAAPGAAPGEFRAAWEQAERDKQERARRRARNRKWALRAGVFAVVVTVASVAYPRVHTMWVARSVSSDLRGYVEGHGPTQTVAGYSVRLPQPATVSLVHFRINPAGGGPVMRAATVVSGDYRIAVWDAAVPPSALPHGALDALTVPAISGPGDRVALHTETIGGSPATVASFAMPDGESRRVAVFTHGGSLFVIRVEAKSAGVVLDTLAHSFHFVP